MRRRPQRNRFRFRLIALTLLALIGGLGSCISRSGEQSDQRADPIVPAALAPSTTASVPSPTTIPGAGSTPSSTRAAPPTTSRTPRISTGTSTTTPAPRRQLIPDEAAPAPSTRKKTSARAEPSEEPGASVYYANCSAVQAAGAAPIRRGDPGYRSALDRDGDGEGCAGD